MDDLISRNAILREIMGRPPEAHYPDYYAAIVQQIPAVQPPVELEMTIYDTEEVYKGCTVQVWSNSKTGETSIGWYQE